MIKNIEIYTMKSLLILIVLILKLTISYSQHYDKFYGKPLIIFQITNPWGNPDGITSFALYENGQVIYKKVINKKVALFSVDLKKEEIEQTIKSLGITDTLQLLPKFTNASPNTTDLLTLQFNFEI